MRLHLGFLNLHFIHQLEDESEVPTTIILSDYRQTPPFVARYRETLVCLPSQYPVSPCDRLEGRFWRREVSWRGFRRIGLEY